MLFILVAPAALAAECATASTSLEIATRLGSAEQAYHALESVAFGTAVDEATVLLPCLDGPIDPAVAAQFHRMQGVDLFVGREPDRAREAFAAARAIEPTYSFPEALVPVGNALRLAYMSAAADVPQDIAAPLAGALWFDGTQTNQRPGTATVLQVVGAQGEIRGTAYLFRSDPLPVFATAEAPIPLAVSGPVAAPTDRASLNLPLMAGSGVAALASGVLYAMAARSNQDFWSPDPEYSRSDLDGLQTQANRQVVLSAGLGVAAVAGLTGAFVVGRRF